MMLKLWSGTGSSSQTGTLRKSLALLLILAMQSGLAAYAKDKPIDWDKKLESGYREMSLGNVDKAMEMFQDKVKHYPDAGPCHTALGLSLKKLGKLAEAKAEFTRSTEVDPSFADGFYELGAMLEGDKD